jgi:hypothetical protein
MTLKRHLMLSALSCGVLASFAASASYMAGSERVTGGDGFRITKRWGGSAGTVLRVEYYGMYAYHCNAGPDASGHQDRLRFGLRLNGRGVQASETQCGQYFEPNGTSHTFAIVELRSDNGRAEQSEGTLVPWLFAGQEPSAPWKVEVWVQTIFGEWDSRYGQNYHFEL